MSLRAVLTSGVVAITTLWLGPCWVVAQTRQGTATAVTTPSVKEWAAPLAADGHPDLGGVWINNSATPFERPKALEGRELLTDAEVAELKGRADRLFRNGDNDFAGGDSVFLAALEDAKTYKSASATSGADLMTERVFDNRTSLIIDPPDGKLPSITSAAQRRTSADAVARKAGLRRPTSAQDLTSALRCITAGVPRLTGVYGAGNNGYYQIVQSPGYVVLFLEVIRELRIIPLDGRAHLPETIRTWEGDSIGRWVGNTLIVDTTNFSPETDFMGSAENLHLTERFTRVTPDEIRYEITVDDPTTWTRQWTAMIRLRRQTQERIYEDACHEGNRPLESILASASAEEKAAKEATSDRAK
jgi:hypothetical protein